MRKQKMFALGLMSVLALGGCYSGAGAADGGADGGGTAGGGPPGEGETDSAGESGGEEPATEVESRFPRLSHTQWENTVRDLLRLDEPLGLADGFIDDPATGGFDNKTSELAVSSTLWGDYQRAAESVADIVVADPEILASLIPADAPTEFTARARAFVEDFGLRAFRRPLRASEIEGFLALFDEAPGMYDEANDAFAAGVHLTVQGMLQSPFFLYRVVDSETVGEDGRIALDSYERASKLSYALWNTMPDDALFAAAASDELATAAGVAAQAERMLQDPRAEAMVADFHRQFLRVDKVLDKHKNADVYPLFYPELADRMVTETQMFIRDVIFGQNETLATLLTAPYTFVNAELAPLYGVQGEFGADFVRVELDATKRGGLLTRLGFLTANAYEVDPDPIHRGAFVSFELLCNPMPPVPDNVSAVEPDPTKTNRERVDAHTGVGTCGAGCHSTLINPAGFAFENYDAIGMWRDEDNGKPVDATGEFWLDGEPVTYDNALEFSQLIASSRQANDCYVRNMLEYTYGRDVHDGDEEVIERLGAASTAEEASIREVVVGLVTSELFLTHPAPEAL